MSAKLDHDKYTFISILVHEDESVTMHACSEGTCLSQDQRPMDKRRYAVACETARIGPGSCFMLAYYPGQEDPFPDIYFLLGQQEFDEFAKELKTKDPKVRIKQHFYIEPNPEPSVPPLALETYVPFTGNLPRIGVGFSGTWEQVQARYARALKTEEKKEIEK